MISIRVIGGLGNQLFQLAAAMYLRDVIGIPVMLDTQFYRNEHSTMDPRSLEIDQLPHGFRLTRGRGNSTRIGALPRVLHRRVVTRGARVLLFNDIVAEVRETNASDETSRALIELSTHEPPFFQSAFIPQRTSTAMRALLETRIPLAFTADSDQPYVGVHSRLGDYLNDRWRNTLGPTDPASLLELGRQLAKKHGDLPIRVFTDSPEVFRRLCPESTVGSYELSAAVSPWDALTEMARSHAFVMSNSTLSWWAAFIATTYRDDPTEVLMPHPWMSRPGTWDELLPLPEWTRFERSLLSDSVDLSEFER